METGLIMKYFVLKPEGDDEYARASRKAMHSYAMHIQNENKKLADDLKKWAISEMEKTEEYKKNVKNLKKFNQ